MTGRPRNTERRQEQQDAFLAAFAKTGVITMAAQEAGIVAPQHHRWLKEDEAYVSRFAELKKQTASLAQEVRRKPGPARGYSGGKRTERKHANQERFLTALAETGIVRDAVRKTELSESVHHLWMREDPAYAERAERVIRETRDIRRDLIRERQSAGSQDSWSDERRAEWGEFQKSTWTPEKREAAGRRVSDRMADPERKSVWEIANRARWANPEAHADNSERMKRLWADPAYRAKVVDTMRTPERRQAASDQMRQQWAQVPPEERREILRKRRAVYKGGYHITQIETIVMGALGDMGVFYQVHKKVDGYVADILVAPGTLIVECDGAWHHNQRKDTDEIRDQRLAELGFRTLRLGEAEIKDGSFVSKLQDALKDN